MRQGCKYCQYNKYDGVCLGSNICSVYVAHINPYSESYCEKFKAKNNKEGILCLEK